MHAKFRPVIMDGITYRVRIKADPPIEESFAPFPKKRTVKTEKKRNEIV